MTDFRTAENLTTEVTSFDVAQGREVGKRFPEEVKAKGQGLRPGLGKCEEEVATDEHGTEGRRDGAPAVSLSKPLRRPPNNTAADEL
jgi:hypothetical protein